MRVLSILIFSAATVFLATGVSWSQELYRIRPVATTGGDFTTVSIYLDTAPLCESIDPETCRVSALSFGIAVEGSRDLLSWSIDGTTTSAQLDGEDPYLLHVREVEGGITFACILDAGGHRAYPAGNTHLVARFLVDGVDTTGFSISSTLGNPPVPVVFVQTSAFRSESRAVAPHVRPVAATPSSPEVSGDESIVVLAPTGLAAAESLPGSGTAGAESGTAGAGVSVPCLVDHSRGDTPPPTIRVPEDELTIQDAVDAANAMVPPLAQVFIEVGPGTYGPLVIDEVLPGGIWIYSTEGPDTTFIEGSFAEPAVVIEANDVGNLLQLGWVTTDSGVENTTGYAGFTIRNGNTPNTSPATGLGGGGVRIVNTTADVVIMGNIIEENGELADSGTTMGSGMWIYRSGGGSNAISVLSNTIRFNLNYDYFGTTVVREGNGAGIWVGQSTVLMSRNFIHDNDFTTTSASDILAAEGGGIAVWGGTLTDHDDIQSAVTICGNVIRSNRAKVGGGIWVLNGADPIIGDLPAPDTPPSTDFSYLAQLRIEDNLVESNAGWTFEPPGAVNPTNPYAGGGLSIIYAFQNPATVPSNIELFVFNNDVTENDISIDPALGAPFQYGGGLYWAVGNAFPIGVELQVVGNYWRGNVSRQGGGIWAYTLNGSGDPCGLKARSVWYNNTITLNNGLEGVGGLFVHENSMYRMSTNILWDNVTTTLPPPPDLREWLVGCPDPCIENASGQWDYSVLLRREDVFLTTDSPDCIGGLFNIYGPTVNTTDDPELRPSPTDPKISTEDTNPVDLGNPAFDPGGPDELPIADDIESETRFFDILNNPPPAPTAVLDRGADELVLFPFIRGDANSDLTTDIADVVLLAQLATGGTPLEQGNCDDALDANDDGAFDLSDSIYLGSFLFQSGPPIAPPWPDCGVDETPDTELCEERRPPCP